MQDPEKVHDRFVKVGSVLGKFKMMRFLVKVVYGYENSMLNTEVAGIKFKNPIGLSAGFDKNCQLTEIIPSAGFGFEEMGSVTGEKCEGNEKPRLFRLKKDKAILVNYGLVNKGAEYLSKELEGKKFLFPVGVSVAKTNDRKLDTEGGIKDYAKAFKLMHPTGDYTTINVSCPNLSDGQTFGYPDNLDKLLKEISKQKIIKPVFLKLKPDMDLEKVDKVLEVVERYKFVTGFIFSNLTVDRKGLITDTSKMKEGSVSGKPVKEKSTKLIRYVYKKTKGKYVIMGCGGIFSAEDAYEKIKAGASLIQLVTGMIYEGPGLIKKINKGLVKLLKRDGFSSIDEAVGADLK